MPDSSGSSVPAVSPNEWNIGSAFKITSCELKSMRAATCSRFASTFACDSATPFGMPSEPDVNSTMAGSSGITRSRRTASLRSGSRAPP